MIGLRNMFSVARIGSSLGSFGTVGVRTGAVSPVASVSSLLFKRDKHEFAPRFKKFRKAHKGRVPVRIGGSIKGNKVEFGTYGLRLKLEGIRMTAAQLEAADKVIRREVRPFNGRTITRFVCNIPVCVKGNQTRMGKGKGAFDHWACRVPTGKVLFEIGGNVHETVAKETLRKASAKLPGIFEIIDKKTPIRVSLTDFIEEPEKVNQEEKRKINPSKKWENITLSREPMYRMFRGR